MKLPNSTFGSAPKQTIMIVDDNAQLLSILQRHFLLNGYLIDSCPSGDAALERLKTDQMPHLLLTDVVMPGSIQGTDLARLAKKLDDALPVVLMSAYIGKRQASALQRGSIVDDFIAKPFRLATLEKVVREKLSASNSLDRSTQTLAS